jgi:uridine kinase
MNTLRVQEASSSWIENAPEHVHASTLEAKSFDDSPHSAIRILCDSRLFWGMLGIKLIFGSALASYFLRDLFIPFLNYFIESNFSNPWTHFAALGKLNSFPYPPAMLYIMAVPRWLFGWILPSGTNTVTSLHLLAMRLPLLAADICIASILISWFPHRLRRVLLFYWCSPFVIYISYWHGQLDIIPTALFLLCLYLLRGKHHMASMIMFGLAISTKSHLLVALPFLMVYNYQEYGMKRMLQGVVLAGGLYLSFVLPFISSSAFLAMVYGTEEQNRLFAFQLPLGSSGLTILLAPSAIAIIWFRFAAYAKRNWDLFMLCLGILFSIFVMLAPPRPGYFLWSLPFLIHFVCRNGKNMFLPYLVYASTYLAYFWVGNQSDLTDAWAVVSPQMAAWQTPYQLLVQINPATASLINNLIFTIMQASLAGIILHMYLFGVRSNAIYRMRTNPVLIGVAGDSGSGKDMFTKLAASILGLNRVSVIAGDDYHRWPRGHEMWKKYTHLDVRGNDLYKQHEHAIALANSNSVYRSTYDHTTGQFTPHQVFDPNEIIIFQGLHSLSNNALRNLYDLKLFLDTEESLRHLWKVRRDFIERGHEPTKVLKSISDREPDRHKYILPQRDQADLIIRWIPKSPIDLDHCTTEPDLGLEVKAINGFNLMRIIERLSLITSLSLEYEPFVDSHWQCFSLSGSVCGETLHAIAREVIPNLEEITTNPYFASDLQGCLQLVFISCLSDKMRWNSKNLERP